jgi:hypothetical protein
VTSGVVSAGASLDGNAAGASLDGNAAGALLGGNAAGASLDGNAAGISLEGADTLLDGGGAGGVSADVNLHRLSVTQSPRQANRLRCPRSLPRSHAQAPPECRITFTV